MSLEKYRAAAERWFAQAQADVKAANGSVLHQSYEWACFQAQQAAEKALKAPWYSAAQEPWGHSLVRLVLEFPTPDVRAKLQELLPHAKKLDKLYIPTRYPNGLPDLIPAEVFTAEEAQTAIVAADEILATARRMIEAASSTSTQFRDDRIG